MAVLLVIILGITYAYFTGRISNNNGYWLDSVSCTNGYTVTNYQTGKTSGSSSQTITINNNGVDNTSTCTFTFNDTCIVRRTGSNNWSADYVCHDATGSGTVNTCYYNNTRCNRTWYDSVTTICTTMAGGCSQDMCNSTLSRVYCSFPSMSQTISCSC